MPKISQEEYEILKGIVDRWKWMARDEKGELWAYRRKPIKENKSWREGILMGLSNGILQFIQWEDENPYNIQELIEDYESEETEVKSKQELIEEWESAIESAEFYGKGKENRLIEYMRSFVDDLYQLDEPETLTPEWIDERIHYSTAQDTFGNIVRIETVPAKFLQNLLVPKSKEITEDLAWELLKEKYEWPWVDLRYTVMQQLEEGTAEAKMANLGYFEVEVDGIKYHVHEDAHARIYDEAYEQGRSDSEREHEGDLPVIPQYVADCLNHGKNELGYNMYNFMHYVTHLDEVKTKWKRAYEWIRKNADKFAKAYLNNGYRIEKESEYFIKVNGKHLTTVNIADTDSIGRAVGDVEIFYEVGDPTAATRFTKKEVEYLERYLNIEVTEVKPLPF